MSRLECDVTYEVRRHLGGEKGISRLLDGRLWIWVRRRWLRGCHDDVGRLNEKKAGMKRRAQGKRQEGGVLYSRYVYVYVR